MPGVALNGASVESSVKSGHVTYEIWRYYPYECLGRDDYGNCLFPIPARWEYAGMGSTNARITTAPIQASTSGVYINGKTVVVVGDQATESWVADPPVPSDTSTTQYRNIRPGRSGSGTASVTFGNSKNVFINGKSVATIGSEVTTHLGNTTRITTGSSNVFIGG